MSCGAPTRCGPARRNGRSRALRRLEIPEDMQQEARLRRARPGRRPGQARDLRRELGQDVPLRDQEGGLARRSLRRHQVGLRAARPRSFEPALRLRAPRQPVDRLRHRRVRTDRTDGWRRGCRARSRSWCGRRKRGRRGAGRRRQGLHDPRRVPRAHACGRDRMRVARKPWSRSARRCWRPASISCRCRSRPLPIARSSVA